MSATFAPVRIVEPYERDLFVVFLRSSVDDPSAVEFWAHSDGAWESSFDWSRHSRPLDRLASAGSPLSNFQSFATPAAVAAAGNVHALLVQSVPPVAPATEPTLSAYTVYGSIQLQMMCGGLV